MKKKLNDLKIFFKNLNKKSIYIYFIIFFIFFALLFSFFLEFFLKIQPCNLCYLQRIPYFFILGFSLIILKFSYKKIGYFGVLACLLANVFISSYHLLVQTHIISDFCAIPQKINSLENFEMLILNQSQSCANISWTLFNLPLSFYNLIFSLGMFILFFLVFYKKNQDEKLNIL